jgi:hypothetical protein
MLRVALRAPLEVDAKTAVSAITPVLVTLFKIRFVLRTLPNPKKLAGKIIDNLKFTPAGNSLDVRDAFVRSCQGVDVRNLLERFSQVLIPGDFDTRHFIRGHDVSAVLVRYISSLYGSLLREDRRYLSQPAAMEITLATCLELVDFDDFDLFRKIREYSLGRS